MYRFLIISREGEVLSLQSTDASSEELGEFTIELSESEEEPDRNTYYYSEGVFKERPLPPTLDSQGVAPMVLPLSELENLEQVIVRNEDQESIEITDFSEDLTLEDSGRYTMYINQKFPHKDFIHEVEVS